MGEIFLEWAAQSMGISLKKKEGDYIQEEKAVKEALKLEEMKRKKEEELAEANFKK